VTAFALRSSSLGILFQLISTFSRKRKLQLCLLLVLIFFSGFAELLSLGAVIPLLTVLSNPSALFTNQYINKLLAVFGLSSTDRLVLLIIILFLTLVWSSTLLRLFNLAYGSRLSAAIGTDLSVEAYRRTLCQSLDVHINFNSSDLISLIISQVDHTVGALNSLMLLLNGLIISLSIVFGLLLLNPAITTLSFFTLTLLYALLILSTRSTLSRNGALATLYSTQQVRNIQEGLGSVRDIILANIHEHYLRNYRSLDRPLRLTHANNQFIIGFPKFILESTGITFIAIAGFYFSIHSSNLKNVIPILGAIALGCQRLLPSLQQVYGGWAAINGCRSSLVNTLETITRPCFTFEKSAKVLPFKDSLLLRDISYSYSPGGPLVLNNINVVIHPGEFIGIVGTTGSGKSTLIDILATLLKPSGGSFIVDGQDLLSVENAHLVPQWRACIRYVPQTIYLTDTSISENIALGSTQTPIDYSRLRRAASLAQLAPFIDSCPFGFDTSVGERGVRISGGQRQRIGIARALYHESEILILDEATSALDTSTEQLVLNSIRANSNFRTIVMITHRTETLSLCDRVLSISNSTIGPYPH
jgi:ABC-type multidrug transport system fused ATPase/permease subunit